MKDRNTTVSRILLIDGVLLIVLAFIHLFATPVINRWLTGDLTMETLQEGSPLFLFNHVVVGILLIPFGVSALYSAAGIRAGNRWTRVVALANALALVVLPLVIMFIAGPQSFTTPPFLIAGISITLIGLSMFIPLVWLRIDPARRRRL
jgi:hypothetical protein